MANEIAIVFTHPNDSRPFNATVSEECTVEFLLDKLVQSEFMPPATANEPYALLFNGKRLTASTQLNAAGVTSGAILNVEKVTQGAAPCAA